MSPNTFQAWLLRRLAAFVPALSIVGGWGAGKSYAMAMWVVERWIKGDPLRPEDGLIVYPQSTLAAKVFAAGPGIYLESLGFKYVPSFKGKPAPHYLAPPGGGVNRLWLTGFYRPSTKSEAASNIEGINAGFAVIDEAQQFAGDEVATTVWGRLRAGVNPQILIVGRPSLYQWWPDWSEQVGGESHKISSYVNKENLPGWEQWIAGMSPQEQAERLHCEPTAAEGSVFSDWAVKTWPAGNMAPAKWQYDPGMQTYLTLDLGYRHPSVLIIARDEELGADVIAEEFNPYDLTTAALGERIKSLINKRGYEIDEWIADKAGNAINEQSAKSSLTILSESLGCRWNTSYSSNKAKTNIAHGIGITRGLVKARQILASQDMWRKSTTATARQISLARAMSTYMFREGSDEPIKDGNEHPIDALRYWVVTCRYPEKKLSRAATSTGVARCYTVGRR